METSVTVALITAGAAMVVAIVSAVSALMSARQMEQAKLEAEGLRSDLEIARDRHLETKAKAKICADALGRACASVQRVRDHLSDLRLERQEPLPRVERIVDACDGLVELFSESWYMFPQNERGRFHDVKDLAARAAKKCNTMLGGRPELADELLDLKPAFDAARDILDQEYNKWQSRAITGEATDQEEQI